MKIIFNDLTEMVIQSAEIQPDGSLLIKTITEPEEQLKSRFQDENAVKKMSVTEREDILNVYEGYTDLEAIVKYTAGIIGVVLYKKGETPEEKLGKLQKTVDMLQECILEMSEQVYQ